MYIGVHVKYRYSCQILIKLESYPQIFKEYSNMKFHKNLSSGSRVVSCGRMEGQIENKVTDVFRETA
jgi:hypothetical protein